MPQAEAVMPTDTCIYYAFVGYTPVLSLHITAPRPHPPTTVQFTVGDPHPGQIIANSVSSRAGRTLWTKFIYISALR